MSLSWQPQASGHPLGPLGCEKCPPPPMGPCDAERVWNSSSGGSEQLPDGVRPSQAGGCRGGGSPRQVPSASTSTSAVGCVWSVGLGWGRRRAQASVGILKRNGGAGCELREHRAFCSLLDAMSLGGPGHQVPSGLRRRGLRVQGVWTSRWSLVAAVCKQLPKVLQHPGVFLLVFPEIARFFKALGWGLWRPWAVTAGQGHRRQCLALGAVAPVPLAARPPAVGPAASLFPSSGLCLHCDSSSPLPTPPGKSRVIELGVTAPWVRPAWPCGPPSKLISAGGALTNSCSVSSRFLGRRHSLGAVPSLLSLQG